MGEVSTSFAYNLNKEMEEHCIRLSYTGEFNVDLISVLLAMSAGGGKMGAVQKKVYNIMIECLENLVNHASSSTDNPFPAIFILAQDDQYHYLCTGNKIHNDDIPVLKSKLDKANSKDKKELRNWYNEVMINGKIPSDTTGAGLGIIDMALRSGNALHFEFTPIDDSNSFFVLKIKIKS